MASTRHKVYDLTVHDAAARARVHPETIRRWVRDGTLDGRKNRSGYWRFNVDDVDALGTGEVIE